MKKIYFLLVFATAFTRFTYAQNTYPYPTAGYLGIGTLSPQGPLHVKGQSNWGTLKITAAADNAEAGFSLSSKASETDYSQSWLMAIGAWGLGTNLAIGNSALGPVMTFNNNNGNIGIGTTNPNAKLTVNSSAGDEIATVGNSDGNVGVSVQNLNGTGNAQFRFLNSSGIEKTAITLINSAETNGHGGLYFFDGVSNLLNFVNGNVGIRTTSPSTALQIGDFNSGTGSILIPGIYNFEQVRFGQISNGDAGLEFVNHMDVSSSYGIKFLVDVDHGSPGLNLQYAPLAQTYNGLTYSTGLHMDLSGNIAIGTTNHPQGYKFAVAGNVIAESMTVKLQGNWPDYVFKKSYNLPSLSAVKTYIDQNHHLPEIPSEKEIAENGLNLGGMNKLLTKKVEELTLYLIEKDKQINDQEKQLAHQNEALLSQQERLAKLEAQVNLWIGKK